MTESTTLAEFSEAQSPTEDNTTTSSKSDTTPEPEEEINHSELPQFEGLIWEQEPIKYKGATIIQAKPGNFINVSKDYNIESCFVRAIVSGLRDHLTAVNANKIKTPPTYKSIREDFTPQVTGYSCGVSNKIGITPKKLETAVRLAVGNGSYDQSKLNIYAGDWATLTVTYGDRQFMIELKQINAFNHNTEPKVVNKPQPQNINGYKIVEDSPQYQKALKTLLNQVIPHLSIEMASYDCMHGSSHQFISTKGNQIKVGKSDLNKLQTDFLRTNEIIGTHTIEPEIGDPKEFTIPDIPNKPGEESRLRLGCGTVIGHQVTTTNSTSGIYSTTYTNPTRMIQDGATAYLNIFTASLADYKQNDSNKQQISINKRQEPVAKYTIKQGRFKTLNRYKTIIADQQG